MEVYRKLGVREVWVFKNNQFEIHHLQGETYEQMLKSEVLPNLDLAILAQYAVAPDPLAGVLEFRQQS